MVPDLGGLPVLNLILGLLLEETHVLKAEIPILFKTWLLMTFLVHFSDFLDPKQDLSVYFFEYIIC